MEHGNQLAKMIWTQLNKPIAKSRTLPPLLSLSLFVLSRQHSRQIQQAVIRRVCRFIINNIHHLALIHIFLHQREGNHGIVAVHEGLLTCLKGLEFRVHVDLVQLREAPEVEFDSHIVVL